MADTAPNGKPKLQTTVGWDNGENPARLIANILRQMRLANWPMSDRQAFLSHTRTTDRDDLLLVLREYAVIQGDEPEK